MRLHLLKFCFLVLLLNGCAIKKPCTIKLEQAPELRGFRLGMSVDEVKKRFPTFPDLRPAELNPENFGKNIIRFDGNALNQYSELKEVKAIIVNFTDSRISQITVFYPNNLGWKSADEFAQKTGEALKLDGSWEKIGEDSSYSSIRTCHCNNFTVLAGFKTDYKHLGGSSEYLPYVEIVNFSEEFKADSRKIDVEKRANQKKEEQKQVFQP